MKGITLKISVNVLTKKYTPKCAHFISRVAQQDKEHHHWDKKKIEPIPRACKLQNIIAPNFGDDNLCVFNFHYNGFI